MCIRDRLGAGSLAQADDSAPKGKIEARSELFAKDHADQFTSWKGTSESRERTDALAEDPQMVVLWAGYPFSKDYNKPRGHFYALTDVRETLRTGAPKTAEDGPLPMACWSLSLIHIFCIISPHQGCWMIRLC